MLSQAVSAYWRQDEYDSKQEPDETPSLFYTALPGIVQRRVPKLPSLRRIASTYGRAAFTHRRTDSDRSDVSNSSSTPPPSYRTSLIEADDEEPEAFHSLPPSRPSTSGSATPALKQDDDSGVRWKYAKQGYSLLSLCAQEESLLAQDPRFSRKLYLDGLGYLLGGLPGDLSVEEETHLRSALPASLVLTACPHNEALVLAAVPLDHGAEPRQPREPTWLHQAVACITLYAFLAFSFILPYLQLLFRHAYAYDRRHKISDRLAVRGWLAADALSKHSVVLANNVYAMNDGQVGIAMKEVGMWWVQGVSGGLYEGVGEGMQALGLTAAGPSRTGSRRRVKGEERA